MPAERRTDEQIRGEISTEREQLASAIADLREDIDAQRRTAEIAGAAVATALAAVAAFRVIRRFRHG